VSIDKTDTYSRFQGVRFLKTHPLFLRNTRAETHFGLVFYFCMHGRRH
jgi:hypothetical protein